MTGGAKGRGRAPERWRWSDDIGTPRAVVRRGGLLAIPTESSYGLAVDPLSERGVRAVYALKRREAGKPLPVVVAGPEQLARLGVDWPSDASGGLERLWPAPLSLLLPLRRDLPAAAGSDRLAVRVPDHSRLRHLLERLGIGLTATSANRAGEPPILDPRQLETLLADVDALIIDGGVLAGGPPSTLVAVEGGVASIVRPGRVGAAALRRAASGLEVRRLEASEDGPVGATRERFSAATVEIPVEESS